MSDRKYASIAELAEEWGLKRGFLYERSRFDQLPGQVRIGRFVKIDRERFREAVERGDLAGAR